MEKRGLVGSLIVVGVLVVVGFFWFVGEMNSDLVDEELVCVSDEDCVRVELGCCPCNMGGAEKCVNVEFEENYLERLENCSEFTVCAAVDKCEIKSCGCVGGVCVGG